VLGLGGSTALGRPDAERPNNAIVEVTNSQGSHRGLLF
jgi:hypothetical protein